MACKNCYSVKKSQPKVLSEDTSTPEGEIVETSNYIRQAFLDRMQFELEANKIKGDWAKLNYSYGDGAKELIYHVSKLLISTKVGDKDKVSEHAADVAVIAMKISESCGVS